MSITTKASQVKLNVMTQEQYNSATKSDTELYMITDAEIVPAQTGNNGKFLKTNGLSMSWSLPDRVSTQNSGTLKFWTGTQAQYDALDPNYDANTLYVILSNPSA